MASAAERRRLRLRNSIWVGGPEDGLSISGALPNAVIGSAYSFVPTIRGGTAPYTVAVTGLAQGLSANSTTGAISGTPTGSPSTLSLTFTVTDAKGATATMTRSLVIAAAVAPLAISGAPGGATVGGAYSFTPSVTGGQGARSFSLSGSLPSGLSFSSSTGAITGTPTTAGTTSGLAITVTDDTGSATLSGLAITVAADGGGSVDWFAEGASTLGNTVINMPAAQYDATSGKTFITYEGWNNDSRRTAQVTSYDHGSASWGPIVEAGVLQILGDDHGTPAIVMDHEGYLHVTHGCHNHAAQWVSSLNPRDTSQWVVRNSLGTGLTYPHLHLIGSTLHGLWRRHLANGVDYELAYWKTTALSGGVATWGPMQSVAWFDADSRFYPGTSLVGSDGYIHLVANRANAANHYRRDVFYLRINPANGDLENFDGSLVYPVASQPVGRAALEAGFRIFTHTLPDEGDNPALVFDAGDRPVVVFTVGQPGAPYKMYTIRHDGTGWSAPVLLASDVANRFTGKAMILRPDGSIELMYGANPTEQRGGSITRIVRDASGVWSSPALVQQQTDRPLDGIMAVKDGRPELRWIWSEQWLTSTGATLDSNAGFGRMYAYGDAPLQRPPPSRSIALSLSNVAMGTVVGTKVATVIPSDPRATLSIINDPSGIFTLSGRDLILNAPIPGVSTVNVTVQATFRGTTYSQAFTLNVLSDALSGESSAFLSRLSVSPDATRTKLYNAYIKLMKAEGLWDKRDLEYLPVALSAADAALNLKSSSYPLSQVGTFDFTADSGLKGAATTDYLDTGFNAATAVGRVYAQNSAHLEVVVGDNANSSGVDVTNTGNVLINTNSFGQIITRMNAAGVVPGHPLSGGTSTGSFVMSRESSTSVRIYRDAACIQPSYAVSQAPTSATFRLGGGTRRIRAAGFGSGLTPLEVVKLRDIRNIYLAPVLAGLGGGAASGGSSAPTFDNAGTTFDNANLTFDRSA